MDNLDSGDDIKAISFYQCRCLVCPRNALKPQIYTRKHIKEHRRTQGHQNAVQYTAQRNRIRAARAATIAAEEAAAPPAYHGDIESTPGNTPTPLPSIPPSPIPAPSKPLDPPDATPQQMEAIMGILNDYAQQQFDSTEDSDARLSDLVSDHSIGPLRFKLPPDIYDDLADPEPEDISIRFPQSVRTTVGNEEVGINDGNNFNIEVDGTRISTHFHNPLS